MSEQKKQLDNKPITQEISLSWVVKGGGAFLLFVFIAWFIQIYGLIRINNFWTYVGFFLSCLGIFYISYTVFSCVSIDKGRIKYFTRCELPSRLNLLILLVFSVFIVIHTALKTRGWLSNDMTDSIMLTALVFPLVFIPAKQTRTATILLVLFALYFFNGIFFSGQKTDDFFILIMGGVLLVIICLGFFSLLFQKPKNEVLLDWTEELQESRRESKEILHLLSEFPDAKDISNIMKVPLDELENAQRPLGRTIHRAVWDLEYEAHQAAEKKSSSEVQDAKKKFISEITSELELDQIKNHKIAAYLKEEKQHILSTIDKSEKHLENIKQHIQLIDKVKPDLERVRAHLTKIEKVKAHLAKTSPRSPAVIININSALENIDLFHRNVTFTLKEAIDVFKQTKEYIKQQEAKFHTIDSELQDTLKKIQAKAHELEKRH